MGRRSRHFRNQKYKYLKKKAQQFGVLFSDPTFPADNTSLFYSRNYVPLPGRVEWKRPSELCDDPKLVVGGLSYDDVVQGVLKNCWFVAACSAVAAEKELWNMVVPKMKEQEWNTSDTQSYAGIFRFRFWQFGEWVEIVIDDRLPTINNQLVFMRSKYKNEFWGPLLEKAYAKLMGSYEALKGGNLSDALVNLTGGISEMIELHTAGYKDNEAKRNELFKTLRIEKENHSLMCCAIHIPPSSASLAGSRNEVGLLKGHAYCITAVRKVPVGGTSLKTIFVGREKLNMIRVRNPWGNAEWNGPFGDRSPEWAKISQAERNKIGLTFDDDGEFWMTFEDFCKHFTDMSVCYILNTSWFSFSKSWFEVCFNSQWTAGPKGSKADRCGGCSNHKDTFLRNPQYCFDIENNEETIMVYLLQKDKRGNLNGGEQNLVIGCHILKVEANRKYRLHTIGEEAATSDYIRTRGIFLKCTLTRGRYLLLPTTFNAGEMGDYMLRVFSSRNIHVKELKKEGPSDNILSCIQQHCLTTLIHVREAKNLEKRRRFGSVANPYCIIKCEGKKLRTPSCNNTLNPKWNFPAVFYRKKPNSEIVIEVWSRNIFVDSFIGRAHFEAPLNLNKVIHELELFGRRQYKRSKIPGTLIVDVITSDDLNYF